MDLRKIYYNEKLCEKFCNRDDSRLCFHVNLVSNDFVIMESTISRNCPYYLEYVIESDKS